MSKSREQMESLKNELQQIRDEIRLKMHLASMELRDRFERIEPEIRKLEHRAEEVTVEVGEELEEGWEHLKRALVRIRDELRGSEKP